MAEKTIKQMKIAFVGGGSQTWAPTIIRDIIFKKGMERTDIEFALLDVDAGRAGAVKGLFDVKFAEWKVDRAVINATTDSREALTGADFVIIAISTGRLPAMRHDLEIPERYGIYHTVGDTCGPGGWSRSLRNIPVFKAYAQQIKQFCPNAFVLNYTNPMGTLTKVLSEELGEHKVVGLCHGLFECYDVFKAIFNLDSEKEIRVRFGGLNHFFWILDINIKGADGYTLLREKPGRRNFAELISEIHKDRVGFSSDKWLAGELYANYGLLPYVGDRHTCEFFSSYITNKQMMERFKLVRTTIVEREKMYAKAAKSIELRTCGEKAFAKTPSRETAADILKAVAFNEEFIDVVNMTNTGQIENLPAGAVVETMGCVDGSGFAPLTTGALPESIKALCLPHAEVQIRTARAGLSGDLEGAPMAVSLTRPAPT